MPKHEPLTPKAIGKRIKAKGLQKIKFYCQMCQKQCRDANGFKCHITSEAHQRQLLLFAENPNRYMDEFSSEFLKDFLQLLKTRFSTRRVLANQVYQEYIKDRHHLHMNATRWMTLTGFVKWLGRKGICNVDCTEKGWFITYIDRGPEALRREEAQAKKERAASRMEDRMSKIIEEQIERGKKIESEKKSENKQSESEDTCESSTSNKEFIKEDESKKVTFSLSVKKPLTLKLDSKPIMKVVKSKCSINDFKEKRKCALDDIIEEQERLKAIKNHRNNWICPKIYVRVLSFKLSEKYYKKIGIIKEVHDKYVAIVRMLDGDVLKLDQSHLETVLPKFDEACKVVNGAYVDCEAILIETYDDDCTIKITSGVYMGRIVKGIKKNEISKLATSKEL